MNIAIVIASNRKDALHRWLNEWRQEFSDVPVYVVEDSPQKTFRLDLREDYTRLFHVAWDDIEAEFPQDHQIFPRHSSAVKSYGFWLARDYDAIWTLDDDCYPEPEKKGFYLEAVKLALRGWREEAAPWYNTIEDTGLYPRGYPYGIRHERSQVMIHHGLWSSVPDLDGITALEYPDFRMRGASGQAVVPRGQLFPMCGMNLAFRREMLPAMYFMLMGSVVNPECSTQATPILDLLPFDRFDDIWAGLFAKRITDHFGWTVTSGAPSIIHTKLSDPTMRVLKEAPGITAHEILWKSVADWDISGAKTVSEAYEMLSGCVYAQQYDPVLKQWSGYWTQLSHAMTTWTELFS